MGEVEASRSIEIDRPVEQVYELVADPANDPRWCRWVVRSELLSGTPAQPGARYRQVQRPGPVGRRIELELLRTDAPKHVRLRWHTSAATFDVTYDLEEIAGSTRMTHATRVTVRGVGRLTLPLVRTAAPRSMAQQLADLRDLLENRE